MGAALNSNVKDRPTTGREAPGGTRRSDVIEHMTVATGLDYDTTIGAFEGEIGRLDPAITLGLVQRKAAWSEVEGEIARIGGEHGLMIIAKADLGAVASLSAGRKRCSLYLVGNPVIANRIISIDLRGSFYVPFRVAIHDDGNPEGAVISYDRPSSFLSVLGKSPELREIALSLDEKIDAVVAAIRKPGS